MKSVIPGLAFLSLFAAAFPLNAQPVLKSVAVLGGDGSDVVTAMALDAAGNTYLSGYTTSLNLATPGSFRSRRSSSNLYSYDTASGKMTALFPPSQVQIQGLAADSGHPGTVYALTSGNIFKTTDNGVTWTTLTAGLPAASTPLFIAVAPSQPSVVYAELFSAGSNVVYKSSDAGATWTQTSPLPYPPNPLFYSSIQGIAVDPFDPSHVIVSGAEAFFTTNGGASWTLYPNPGGLLQLVFDPTAKGVIYASTDTTPYLSLLRSADGGQTFTSLPIPNLYFIDSILPDPRHPGTVYLAGFGNTPTTEGIFKTTNAGTSWSLASNYEASLVVADFTTGVFYLTEGSGVLISTDNLQTVHLGPPYTGYVSDIAVSAPGTLMIATDVKSEGYLSKLDPNGKVVFTTYLGGLTGSSATALALDSSGSIYLAAASQSLDFPQTAALPGANPGLFLMKMAPDATALLFSTLVSASGTAEALTVDPVGNIYIAGTAGQGYPTTPNSAQPEFYPYYPALLPPSPVHTDAFATKFAPDGKTLLYSTYFGEAFVDRAHAMVVDTDGSAYIAGTRLWKLNPSGTALTWSTVLPPGEFRAATLDAHGNLYVCGGTFQGNPLYTSPNAYQPTPPLYLSGSLLDSRFDLGNADAFVAKFSPSGNVLYSTLFGGTSGEAAQAISVDSQGNATVVGTTESLDLPMLDPLQEAFNGQTGFLAKFNPDGSQLLYSTYLGDARPFTANALARRPDGTLQLAGYSSTGYSGATSLGNHVFLNVISETQTSPALHIDHVLNEANRQGGPAAPGEWIVLHGAGFTSSSQLLLNGLLVPVTSVTSSEILARLPDSIPLGPATLTVNSGSGASTLFLDVANSAPAFFTTNGTGSGQAIAVNADGTLNGPNNPAPLGSAIQIAVNGIGAPGENNFLAYFQTGIAVPATVVNAPVPGLPGKSYTLLSTVIPTYPYKPGAIIVSLELNGVMLGPQVSIAVQ